MQEINLDGQSLDIVEENVVKLKQLFPEIVTEDNIDFDKLKAVLGEYIEKDDESYRFTWYGKRDAFRKSQIPSTGTLRPCIEESKDWDTTQNLYIEGDNLEVLKLLQKSYNNKIKMIYIDPPYNKDKDFIYPDKWSDPIREYKRITGQIDEDGNVKSSETEDAGGRHTNWLNMMYPRLRLAKNLLSKEGVIFISIDDLEIHNLKKLCDNDVFGEENFIACLVWEKKKKGSFLSNDITNIKEYILVYAKNKNYFEGLIGEINTNTETYPCVNASNKREIRIIPKGIDSKYKEKDYSLPKGSIISDTTMSLVLHSDLVIKDGVLAEELIIEGNWRYSQEAMKDYSISKEIYITRDLYLRRIVSEARNKTLKDLLPRLGEVEDINYINVNNLFETGWGSNEDADEEQRILFGVQKVMDYPKPVKLLYKLIASFREEDYIVLDFFAGSATTAHAVMKLNADTNGNRKYIMVQLPEDLDRLLSDASDDNTKKTLRGTIEFLESIGKVHSIAEIGKERIRRAGENIKAELKERYNAYQQKQQSILEDEEEPPMNPDDLDIGFKVFKLDNSNLNKWSVDVGEDFYKESKETQNAILSEMLGLEVDNFVEGRSELDVVYEIMLKYGLDLTYPIETYDFDGTNIYSIGFGGLIVCLDTDIKAELADKIVELIKELEPSMVRVAVRDLSFESDAAKTNFKETLKNGVYAYFESNEDKADKHNQFTFITI